MVESYKKKVSTRNMSLKLILKSLMNGKQSKLISNQN